MERRTKIVCTLGPASSTPEIIRKLAGAGMNVARLNFSHGTHQAHAEQYRTVREVSSEMQANVAILMDLQGPKIRTGRLKNAQPVELVRGAELTITTRDLLGGEGCISTTYQHLPQDVSPGDRILIADGLLELTVKSVNPPEVRCEVVRGGMLGEHKGINLPGVRIAEPSLTAKDKEDLAFGLSLGVDYVALSFVRSPDDLRDIRGLIREAGAATRVVSKIERPEALEHFEEIVRLSDGIMVARGDLGVEIPFEEVPIVQKRLIRTCNELGVPVITATQMLESMTEHPRPTRAEATDVANAIFDGTDAVMLSAETAAGMYPVETCAVMARIARRADEEAARSRPEKRWEWLQRTMKEVRPETGQGQQDRHAHAIGLAISQTASTLDVRRIVCFTSSGYTAAAIARYRPAAPITALTTSETTQHHCSLFWGVSAIQAGEIDSMDRMIQTVERLMQERNLAKPGDTIIITAGYPLAVAGRTNFLKLHTIGE
jgi:pyruvate kinase